MVKLSKARLVSGRKKSLTKSEREEKLLKNKFVDRNVIERIKHNMEVRKVVEKNQVNVSKKRPAIQYDELGLPRVLGRGARNAHKRWLKENGYERD